MGFLPSARLAASMELPADCPFKHRFWAPEIHEIGGKFHLIFTADNWTEKRYEWVGGPQNGCAASLQWNLILDRGHGPILRAESEATAMAAIDIDRWEEVRFEREYYAIAQMSLAAPPGSRRLPASMEGTHEGLEVAAFALGGDRTSLVVFNGRAGEVSFQVESAGRYFRYALHGRSIVTFVW